MRSRPVAAVGPLGVALIAIIFGACGLMTNDPPIQACATPDEGYALADEDRGFELCLPPNWRDLAPGDPGWVTVYGGRDLTVEGQVRDGIIQHFAVPLEPRDADLAANVAVYVRDVDPTVTLDDVATRYAGTMDRANINVTDRQSVTLPAGPAVRIEGVRPPSEISTTVDRMVAYVLVHGNRTFHVLYVSMETTGDHYEPMFDASIRSLRFSRD
jgi:hypothetical protein